MSVRNGLSKENMRESHADSDMVVREFNAYTLPITPFIVISDFIVV